jgi:thioredoxin reductase (NADPH)
MSESTTTNTYDVIVIGAGPIGLCCGIEAQRRGLSCLIIEKGCIVNSLFHYPSHMRFFSTSVLLEIGGIPFASVQDKPTRLEALEYYRRVAESANLNINLYEKVTGLNGDDGNFEVNTSKGSYHAKKIISAIGFFDIPRLLNVPGEELDKVTHYYDDPHVYANQDVLIAGSGNSAAITALECVRHGAKVTTAVRGDKFHDSIKYWIRPDLENRISDGEITPYFNTVIKEIHQNHVVLDSKEQGTITIKNDFVIALTGYEPDFSFLQTIGIELGEDVHKTPKYNPETCESNRTGVYLAGVVVGGLLTNKWFIENSRVHATQIFDHITCKVGAGL